MEYIELLSEEKKIAFMVALAHIGHADSDFDKEEEEFIKQTGRIIGIEEKNIEEIVRPHTDDEVAKIVSVINDRRASLELVREMCTIAHEDGDLADDETIAIAKIGLAMGVDLAKIEEISQWVIQGLILREEGQIIFEEVI